MKLDRWFLTMTLGALVALASGCNHLQGDAGLSGMFGAPRITVPAGTLIKVELAQTISSESARRGDAWRGALVRPVVVEGREVIPAGSRVEGTVVAAREARRGNRASLELGVRAIRIGDRKTALMADGEPVVAGSPRTRNLGAIAGGAAAGALLGRAIGGDGDDAAAGAVLGGAAATGVVAASRGYQVVFAEGSERSFVVRGDVPFAMR